MDVFKDHTSSLTAPARRGATVTPSDDEPLAQVTRAIYVGGAGDVAVEMADGDSVVFVGLTGGTLLPVRAARILATGTSAGAILALW